MKKYLILLAGAAFLFQACSKPKQTTSPTVVTACLTASPSITSALDSGQTISFDASCSTNGSTYAWTGPNGANGNAAKWSTYFVNRSSTPNKIKLVVKAADGTEKDSSFGVICGFHQFQSFTINSVPDSIKTEGFYIGYGPRFATSANAADFGQTALTKITTLPVTVQFQTPISIMHGVGNDNQWKITVVTASGGVQAFPFPAYSPTATPTTRTTKIANAYGYDIDLNYTISAN